MPTPRKPPKSSFHLTGLGTVVLYHGDVRVGHCREQSPKTWYAEHYGLKANSLHSTQALAKAWLMQCHTDRAVPEPKEIAMNDGAIVETGLPILIQTSLPTEEDALRFVEACVDAGLAAGGQVSAVRTIYAKKGERVARNAASIQLSTVAGRFQAIGALLQRTHEDHVLIAIPMCNLGPNTKSWILRHSATKGPESA